jgi:predicted Zn-dependent protease
LPVVQTTVEINHLGYDGNQAHKHARNLALLQTAVRTNPDRVYYWYHLAETLSAIGHADEAAAAAAEGLAAAVRNDADDQRTAASMIFQLMARTQIEQNGNPLGMIDHALARVPDDYALWFLRGRALLDADRPGEALEIAKELRAIDPERLVDGLLAFDSSIFKEKACELAALACLRLGRRQDAAEYFVMASSLAPGDFAYRIKAAALSRLPTSRQVGTGAEN